MDNVVMFFILILAANVDEDILLGFTREDLKDLFGGADKFLLRRQIWNLIERTVSFLFILTSINK